MKTSHCIVERVDFDVSMCASPDFCIRDDISEFARREYVCGAFTLRPYSVVNIIKITEWGQHIFQSTLIFFNLQFQSMFLDIVFCKSLSEPLILVSTNPQHDKRLFIDLPVLT